MILANKTMVYEPTKYGAKNSNVTGFDGFLNGTSNLVISDNSTSTGAIIFYDFDIGDLAQYSNIRIKNISVKIQGSLLVSAGNLTIKLIKNFKTSGNSVGAYNDLGDGQKEFGNIALGTFKEDVVSDFPNAVAYLNENLSELINNPESTIFGIRFYGKGSSISSNYGIQLELEVEFESQECTVTVLAGNAGGTVTGGGTYGSGGTITIEAIPDNNYKFVEWSDGDVSNPRTVTVFDDITYIAYFKEYIENFIIIEPTKYGANANTSENDSFLNGSSDLYMSETNGSKGTIVFYSFYDLSKLSNLENLVITGISVSLSCKSISNSGNISFKLVKNFKTSGSSVNLYNDLGDGAQIVECNTSAFTESIFSDFPNAISHLNENINEFMINPETTTFGIRLYGSNVYVSGEKGISVKINYITTSAGAGGAMQLYINTVPVKGVYVGDIAVQTFRVNAN